MKFFMPYLKIGGMEFYGSLKNIKDAGFDGVEMLLGGDVLRRPEKYAEEAKRLGLEYHFHALWSLEDTHTSTPGFHHKILKKLNFLLPKNYSLDQAVPSQVTAPVVVNGNFLRGALLQETLKRPNLRFQTFGLGKISFNGFVDAVKKHNLPVVFDTEHAIEFFMGVEGVSNLPHECAKLNILLTGLWTTFKPFTKEIHFNNCIPRLGLTKVLPNKGTLILKQFAHEITESGWDGVIIAEVTPGKMLYGLRLRQLRKCLDKMFSKS